MIKGRLILLPNHLDMEDTSLDQLPKGLETVVKNLDGVFVESEKGARRFLKCFTFDPPKTFRDVKMKLLNEHSIKSEIQEMVHPLLNGEKWGVLSDCAMPCLADPGSELVREVEKHQIPITIFHGPSSITHALILSGFNAQSFSFHGYLPRKEDELCSKLVFLEKIALKSNQTQIFIEAPYRNQKLLNSMLVALHPNTKVCIAMDLMTKNESVIIDKISVLRKRNLNLPKSPAVFLISGLTRLSFMS